MSHGPVARLVGAWVARRRAAALDLQAAADYLGWLELEANRSRNTVVVYRWALRRLATFLSGRGHSLRMAELGHEDLRAYQRHLALTLKQPSSRATQLIAIRSWLHWLARERMVDQDLSAGLTLPKLEERLPKPMAPDELARLLTSLPSGTAIEKRDRALVHFLISTGCRISEGLQLDRTDVPLQGNRLVVTGKGSKERIVYLTDDARTAIDDYLRSRADSSLALFVNYSRAGRPGGDRRLTSVGARYVVNRVRRDLGVWSFRSPHVARHTAATRLLEVTGGDVRLVQEVLGHANLNTLQGYTKIVDARLYEAYRRYQEYLRQGMAAAAAEAPRQAVILQFPASSRRLPAREHDRAQ